MHCLLGKHRPALQLHLGCRPTWQEAPSLAGVKYRSHAVHLQSVFE